MEGEDCYWECKLSSWYCFLSSDKVDCYKKEKDFGEGLQFLSHCCDVGGVVFTSYGIVLLNGPSWKLSTFTATQWLHIVAGLHHSNLY